MGKPQTPPLRGGVWRLAIFRRYSPTRLSERANFRHFAANSAMHLKRAKFPSSAEEGWAAPIQQMERYLK
jgi:hypothetical protein